MQYNHTTATPQQWWWQQRIKFNRGLLISGAAMFAYCILIFLTFNQAGIGIGQIPFFALAYAFIFAFYVAGANAMFTIGWLAELLLKPTDTQKFRALVYNCGYWFALLLPWILPLGFLLSQTVFKDTLL